MQIGRILGSVYRIDRRLGAGGIGAVFEATHLRTGRRYAVKVLLPEVALQERAVERFRREAEVLASIGHAGIVSIHDFDTDRDGTQFLVMDLLEGEDLASRIARNGPLALPDAVRVLEEIGSALSAAHARGIVHRDLKPANVFLARRPGAPERAMILDFGLAKNVAADVARLTSTGVGMGTPLYMSPEQARGEDVDFRTDVYSLGCIFFEMTCGTVPFVGPTIAVVMVKILTEPPPRLSECAPRPVPRALDEVVATALAKSATDRYGSVDAFVDAVRRAAGDSSEQALAATVAASDAELDRLRPMVLAPTTPLDGAARVSDLPIPPTRLGSHAMPSARPPSALASEAEASSAARPEPVGAIGWARRRGARIGAAFVATAFVPLAAWLLFRAPNEVSESAQPSPPRTAPDDLGPVEATSEPSAPSDRAPGHPIEAVSTPDPPTEAPPPASEPPAPRIETVTSRAPRARRLRDAPQEPEPTTLAESDPGSSTASSSAPVVSSAPPLPEPSRPTEVRAPGSSAPASEALVAAGAREAAAVRAFDVQIAANERRIREYEAFLPDVIELRRQARRAERGETPTACSGPSRARLEAGARSDDGTLASLSSSLENALDAICVAFQHWLQPPASTLVSFAAVGREIEQAERMIAQAPSNAPPEQIEAARQAIAAVRRAHESRAPSFSRYPCRSPEVAALESSATLTHPWCRAAADRARRAVDRACSELGMSERRLALLTQALSVRADAAERTIRESIRSYEDLNLRLRAARAGLQGATP